ncbi:aldo/keto reductase [Akkermansiaceae bacterium]|nr:aldo/keto reductase [Akkermansiaceae bacterium]
MIGRTQKINRFEDIIYGTAKLGDQKYGFSSIRESLFLKEEFINNLLEKGVERFDTSPRYGDAQLTLGKALKNKYGSVKVDSKIVGLKPNDSRSRDKIFEQVETSLKHLNRSSLNVLYLHQNQIKILKDKMIQNALKEVLENGLAKKIGTSVYSHLELEYSLQNDLFNTIQVPVNILNTSFYDKFLASSKKGTKELIARSVFLQGTLLNVDEAFLRKINIELYNKIQKLEVICKKHNTTMLNEAKKTVYQLFGLKIIQSSLSFKNIKSNLCFETHGNDDLIEKEIRDLRDLEYTFTNPRNWNI